MYRVYTLLQKPQKRDTITSYRRENNLCTDSNLYKTFRDIVLNCCDTKIWYVLHNLAYQVIHSKVKWSGRHINLQKSKIMFYIEKFDEMLDYNCKWNPTLCKTMFCMIMEPKLATILVRVILTFCRVFLKTWVGPVNGLF